MHWLTKQKDDLGVTIAIIIISIAVFLFFKTFFDVKPDDLTIEILAALLGSVLTVMITMLLIKRQGSIEQAQEAAATSKGIIFEKKLALFQEFIQEYVRSAIDGKLDINELSRLEELALTISLFTNYVPAGEREADLGEELCAFVYRLQREGISHEEDCPSLRHFLFILRLMKVELGLAQASITDFDLDRYLYSQLNSTFELLSYRGYRQPNTCANANKENCETLC